tara:strand:+ start:511 stop:957 length:447 start_codon:yes stop_codon:yes gene_type:complete
MAYNQTNNPFAKTSCGRRYGPANGTNNNPANTPLKCWSGYERVPGTKEFDKGSCKKSSPAKQTAAWTRKEGKNPKGGLNQKGVDSYKKENPGSKLQTAVTKDPSKIKKGSKDANRRKSFCARMGGMPGDMMKNGKPTRKKLALDKWNC